tara:strand:+ start:315 stop:869 length:555 start_codon:yes stop_codon:yes gene_type:complete
MDELIDILDSEGKFTGTSCLKSIAHKEGLYHATTHVWFYTDDEKILLQKRAAVKKVFPNLWDVSVAGHIGAGEKITTAAIREVKEEIGLTISENQLIKIGLRKDEIIHPNGILDNEFKHIFICKLTVPVAKLTRQIDEVDALQLFDFTILKDASKHGNFTVPNINKYYDFVYDEILKIITSSLQ